ncbi:hypothetical protein GQ457_06G027170 [Hibiscus cannabinus]
MAEECAVDALTRERNVEPSLSIDAVLAGDLGVVSEDRVEIDGGSRNKGGLHNPGYEGQVGIWPKVVGS